MTLLLFGDANVIHNNNNNNNNNNYKLYLTGILTMKLIEEPMK